MGEEYRDSSITDLASVPRIFWTPLPPDGKYAKAAIIHDYLYDNALRTKKEADLILLDGMTVLGVPKWKRTVMYWVGGLLSAMLFILTYLLNQYRNNVKANEKDDKDQKERLNCCEHGM